MILEEGARGFGDGRWRWRWQQTKKPPTGMTDGRLLGNRRLRP
ncbi:MAG: hypothetical protein ACE5FD_00495 [Anaerolineae bacterium]